jgi:hypothetical protein
MAAIVAGALLFAPLIFIFLAGFLTERRNPTASPDWIIYARVLSVGLVIIAPALAYFIERQIRLLPAEQLSQLVEGPELIAFVTGSASFLTPATIGVISFLVGAPANDVYLCSTFSFLGILFWSWRRRALVRASNQYPMDVSHAGNISSQTIPLSRSYTIILSVLGVLALLFLIPRIIAITRGLRPIAGSVSLESFVLVLYVILVLGCWATVRLRAWRSPYALAAASIISAILLCWIPLGTAASIYWIGWVRKKELN